MYPLQWTSTMFLNVPFAMNFNHVSRFASLCYLHWINIPILVSPRFASSCFTSLRFTSLRVLSMRFRTPRFTSPSFYKPAFYNTTPVQPSPRNTVPWRRQRRRPSRATWGLYCLGLECASSTLDTHVMVNWSLSKQSICWPISRNHVAGVSSVFNRWPSAGFRLDRA